MSFLLSTIYLQTGTRSELIGIVEGFRSYPSIHGLHIGIRRKSRQTGRLWSERADPVVSNFYHSLQAAEHRQQTDQAPKKVKVETRGRKSTWRGEKTVIIRVPARLAERLKAEAHRFLEEEMAESEDYSLINH